MERMLLILAILLAVLGGLVGCGNEEEQKRQQAVALLDQLNGGGPEAQPNLVEELVALGKPAVAPLIEALPDSSEGDKRILIEALGRIKDVTVLDPLIQELKTGSPEVRQTVVRALGVLASIDGLRALSDAAEGDPSAAVRMTAAASLGQLNNPRVIPVLLRVLRDPSQEVRRAAIASLGNLGEPALNPLLEARQEEAVSTGAQLALEQLAQKFKEDLRAEDTEVRVTAVQCLGRIGDPENARPLSLLLMDPEEKVRLATARSLERLRNPATKEPLRQTMQRPEETVSVRLAATIALAKMGDAEALQRLVEALADPQDIVRVAAAIALGEAGEAARPVLMEALQSSEGSVRAAAARALGSIGGKEGIPTLLEALQDPDPYVRAAAALSLGKMGSEKVVAPLLKLLNDADPLVSWCASWALEETGKATLPALLRAARKGLSANQARLLGRIQDERGSEVLVAALENPQQQKIHPEVIWALGQIGTPRNVIPLLRALDSPEEVIRQAAAVALARLRRLHPAAPRGSEEPFSPALTQKTLLLLRSKTVTDPSPAVRRAAERALMEWDPDRRDVVEQWRLLLSHQEAAIRAAAARRLGQRGHLTAIPALEKALTDPHPQVQEAARSALHAITGRAPQETARQM